MQETTPIMQWPVPSGGSLLAFALLFGLLLCAAFAYEWQRRNARLRQKVEHEARAMLEILEEHSLSPEEVKTVADLVTQFSPNDPLRAVTTRHEFDRCVEAKMAQLTSKGDQEQFEQMGIKLRDIRANLGLDYIPYGQRIHSTREIHPGQWLSVARAAESAPQWMRMVVEEVDESYLTLSRQPKPGEPTFTVRPGDDVRFSLWRDDDARYTFVSTVATIEDDPKLWRVAHTSELSRLQARGHFRIRHDQMTIIELLNAPVDGNLGDVKKRRAAAKLRGRVTSLSAGGCALVVQQPVSKHMLLRVWLEVPNEREPIRVEGRIVAVSAISGGRFLIRASFVGLDNDMRDKVSRYVSYRQQSAIATPDRATG